MKYFVALCLFAISFPCVVSAQFSDDFNDGDFIGWEGNIENFIVNASGQLQLNAPSGSTSSWIYTPVTFVDSMVWDFYLKLDFAPSTSNQLRVYLGLTSPDLATASGYFLEIGASGDQDALELKYLENNSSSSIASSAPGLVALEPVELSVRVVRNDQGVWQIFNTGGSQPELLFSAQHDILSLSSLTTFGFYEKYTDTRRDKFYFDDVAISLLQADQNAPEWLEISVIDNNTVHLIFNEPLDPSSEDPIHYLLTPGNSMPNSIDLNGNELTLSWAQTFVNQQDYLLTVNNLSDLAGNILLTDNKNFSYIEIIKADPFELLITEIMADPTPTIGLPDAEYLEIHNTSSDIFNLSDYIIRIGTNEKTLPDSLIYPNEFVILTGSGNTSLLSSFGRVIGLQSMSALTNSGTTLAILDQQGIVIHELEYTLDWYHDAIKSAGGWSIEMINPAHICTDVQNWKAASNLQGGTPGEVNSEWTTTPDIEGPGLISLFTGTPDVIVLRFDERLEPTLMLNPGLYSFEPALQIGQVDLVNPTTIQLNLVQPLVAGTIYRLLSFSAIDCLGNGASTADTLIFGVVVPPAAGDILINEILFNPGTGGSRFLEIINASEKFINLSSLAIGRINATHNDIYPTGINEILAPGEIAVFTPEPADILSRYTVPHPAKLYDSVLPSWDDKTDHAAIIAGGEFIDSFTYSSSWHHPVISDQNGVSLERISLSGLTSSASTWHSASSVSGYATPTGVNSQALNANGTEEPFSITNKQFSPNDDGYKDYLIIDFQLTSGDDVGSVWIYDLEGREIRELLSNEILGTSAFVQWDGRNDEGQVADMGIYVILVQLWDPEGDTKEYKKTCALVKR